jgi:hypothetical protein
MRSITPADLYGRVLGALRSLPRGRARAVDDDRRLRDRRAGLVPTIVVLGALHLTLTIGMLFDPVLRRLGSDRSAPSRRTLR